MGGRPTDTPAAVAIGPDPREHNRRVMSSDIRLCQSSLFSYSVSDFMIFNSLVYSIQNGLNLLGTHKTCVVVGLGLFNF